MRKKSIICLVVSIVVLCMFSCAKKEDAVTIETTTTKKVEETLSTIKQTTARALNEDIRVDIFEQDKKTSYNVVKFGKYDTEIGRSGDIEWLVVDGNDNSYLLVSRYIIDCKNYNDTDIEVLWNNSTLNSWLNNYFLNSAFSSDEIAYMNSVNEFGLLGREKVGLLNIASCQKYFGREDVNKRNYRLSAEATNFAISNWLETLDNKNSEYYRCGSFYLTDNGTTDRKAAWVGQYGHIYIDGQAVKLEHGDGVRPVIVVKKELFGENKTIVESTSETAISSDAKTESIDESISESETTGETTSNEIVNKQALINNNPYSNISKEKHVSELVPHTKANAVDLYGWEYGRTPITWVYVAPNTQIISNNSPNMSRAFSYKAGASSGSKGCYMSIFSKGECLGTDWDGRLYTVEDYKKSEPENLDFEPIFDKLAYGEHNVKELLSKRYTLEDVTSGLIKANGEYVNVIYVSELDEIIASMK